MNLFHNHEDCIINSIHTKLMNILFITGEFPEICLQFSALETDAERFLFAHNLLRKYSLYPHIVEKKKNDEVSAKYRYEGNEAFKKKDTLAAWSLYTRSIAYATPDSEYLALAYGNRSAVLFENKLYKECLEDIRNAFENNYPECLYGKLIRRQEKARELIGTQKILKYYEDVEELAKIQKTNKRIECAGPKVEIKKSQALGRHVVAVDDIKLGEVIAVEKPYAQVLLNNSLQDHCYHCLQLCYNMLPCDSCVYAMFCCKECKRSSWDSYHKYECSILPTLYDLGMHKLTLSALRVAIVARNDYDNIRNYNPNRDKIYKSQSYEEIHFLHTNTHMKDFGYLFFEAFNSAVLWHIVKEGSRLLKDFVNLRHQVTFVELIMRHFQTGATNFHEISEFVETDRGFLHTNEIGVGAYAFLSLLNHSCAPNVTRDFHGTEVILRAIKPIKKGDQLFDHYGCHYALMDKAIRQERLKKQYFFDCACEACQNDWPMYRISSLSLFWNINLNPLVHGDRDLVRALMNGVLHDYGEDKKILSDKEEIDLQETLKQCFGLLGNRKPKF